MSQPQDISTHRACSCLPLGGDRTGLIPAAHSVPSLIPLPRYQTVRRARRPSAKATAWLREHYRVEGRVAPRRRLRREIRVVGAALLLIAPLTFAGILLASPRGLAMASRAESTPDRQARPTSRPPAISLMIEAPPLGFRTDAEPPVVLPGYVLPDDGAEEPFHAGG
jgi:hypothetical protein